MPECDSRRAAPNKSFGLGHQADSAHRRTSPTMLPHDVKAQFAMNHRQPPKCASRQAAAASAGFTLIELMIALALAAILVATAAPNWRAFLATAEIRDRSEALMRALSVARS